ncbi:hydroxyacid dehydrogenase [Brachybacterium paraconglomeratum]|uniref:hydroxyacid dehydrogenase n=1 Tax=Brachybacterium paraconglomeratum TaxID=173362 RepID=UPI003F7B39D6
MITQTSRPTQHVPSVRPAALLAMSSGLDAELFTPEQRRRLGELVDLLAGTAVPDLSTVPDETAARAEILVTGWGAPRIDANVLERMPRLRAIVHAAGTVAPFVDNAVWDREDIAVSTAAQANAVPVAEYALAQILLAGKRSVTRAADYRRTRGREGAWTATGQTGNYGAVVGLIGASRTGKLTAQHLQPFDIEVLVHDPFAGAEEIAGLGARKVDLEQLFRASDVVSLHAPDVPSTRGMITGGHFALMRDGSTFLNTARPALVDEDALRIELVSGRISAVLDVHDGLAPDDPLWDLPNVQLTPHIAGSQGNELHRLAESVLEELERLARGEMPLHALDRRRLDITA